MLADRLANEGVTNTDRDSRHGWVFLPPSKLREDCLCNPIHDMELWTNREDKRNPEDQREV